MMGNYFFLLFFLTPFVASKLHFENAPLNFGKGRPFGEREERKPSAVGEGQKPFAVREGIAAENLEQAQPGTVEAAEGEARKPGAPSRSIFEIVVEAVENGATGLKSVAGGVGTAALHPLNTTSNAIKQSQSAISGGLLGASIMEKDPILNQSARDSKKIKHLLDDSVALPGDTPFPPRVNTVGDYPNPLTDPLACHRRGRSQSHVCDPDDVLGHSKAEEIEEVLEEVRRRCVHPCGSTFTDEENETKMTEMKLVPCSIVVAVTRTIPNGATGESMAADLLRRFNFGQKECQDGVLLLYSDVDKKAYIRWNKGEENRLNENSYASLQPVLNNVFRSSAPDDALTRTVAIIDMQQSGQMPQPRHPAHFWFLLAAFLSIGLLFMGFFIASVPRAKPEETGVDEEAGLLPESDNRPMSIVES